MAVTMTTWTTDSVMEGQRFDFWQDVVCQSILNVAADLPAQLGFHASLYGQSYGALRVASFRSREHQIMRSLRHIKADEDPSYIISLQIRGRSDISQGDCSFSLEADEIAIVDGSQPFQLRFSSSVERLVAVVPRSILEPRIPWLKRHHTLKISREAPYAELARPHIHHLVQNKDLQEIEANLLAENLCNLLALSTRETQTRRLENDVQFEMITSFCRNNLSNSKLSPGFVASYFGISLRTLHVRFEKFGQPFGDWVLERRLESCRQALRDPKQSDESVSEIVYRAGFNDLSHFCRMFKRRFGLTAREWRSQTVRPN